MMHAPACAQAAQPADSEPAPAPAAHDSEQKITLCCKYAGGEVRIKMRPSDPIRKLLVAFMKVNPSAPQDPSKYKIKFDGGCGAVGHGPPAVLAQACAALFLLQLMLGAP